MAISDALKVEIGRLEEVLDLLQQVTALLYDWHTDGVALNEVFIVRFLAIRAHGPHRSHLVQVVQLWYKTVDSALESLNQLVVPRTELVVVRALKLGHEGANRHEV